MTEHLLHIQSSGREVGKKRPGLSGTMMDMERNQSLPLTPYEAGQIATVVNGEARLRGERVVYLHQDNTPERTASGSLVDLKTDQPRPLTPDDAEKIADVVRRIEEIEASHEPEGFKRLKRAGAKFDAEEHLIMGYPTDRSPF